MRKVYLAAFTLGAAAFVLLEQMPGQMSESDIQRGLSIAPVQLDLKGKNLSMVARGSYLVNGVAGCNDCHTCPSYQPGQNPGTGADPGPMNSPGPVNAASYLAGGVPLLPGLSSPNLTPNTDGKPAGMTRTQFMHTIRTGRDHEDPGHILQVMPWPVFRHMVDSDLKSIYEYLRAIPPATTPAPGTCFFPGQ